LFRSVELEEGERARLAAREADERPPELGELLAQRGRRIGRHRREERRREEPLRAPEHLVHELLLALDVPIERRWRNTRRLGDLGNRGPMEPALRKQRERRLEDLLLPPRRRRPPTPILRLNVHSQYTYPRAPRPSRGQDLGPQP